MSQKNVKIVKRCLAAYNRRDFKRLRELSHRELELDWSASRGLDAGVYRGVEEVMRFHQRLLDMFDQVDIEPNRFIKSGDSVLVPNTTYFRGRDGIETVASEHVHHRGSQWPGRPHLSVSRDAVSARRRRAV